MARPAPWKMGEMLKTQSYNSLLRYGIFYRASGWACSFGTI